jgi:hypothetical protein
MPRWVAGVALVKLMSLAMATGWLLAAAGVLT